MTGALLTIPEAAALIGTTEKALRHQLQRGSYQGRVCRLGVRVRLPRWQLEHWIATGVWADSINETREA